MVHSLLSGFLHNPLSFGLSLLFLISTHIIIVNEELLVALSFAAFWMFSNHMLSGTISENFEQRKKDVLSSLSSCFQSEQIEYKKSIENAVHESLVFSNTKKCFFNLSSSSEGVSTSLKMKEELLDKVYNSSVHFYGQKTHQIKSTEMNEIHKEFSSLLLDNMSKNFSSLLVQDAKKNLMQKIKMKQDLIRD